MRLYLRRPLHSRRPLLLCYHGVSSAWPCSLAMSEALLAKQLHLLRRRKYVGLTFAEAERRRTAGALPPRAVAVTFDDGLASVLRAKPILDDVGFPATVFVVTDYLDDERLLAWREVASWLETEHADELAPLTWEQAADLARAGWEIGSHTVSHPWLPNLPDEDLDRQLVDSRAAIEQRLGSCETLAYPFGVADERVAAATRRAGYLAACTLTAAHRIDEPFRRPRVGLFPPDDGLRVRAKFSPALGVLRRTVIAELAQSLREQRAGRRTGHPNAREH